MEALSFVSPKSIEMSSDPYIEPEGQGPSSGRPGRKLETFGSGDIDALEGDELEQLQTELWEEANLAAEDDYYAILNVGKDVRCWVLSFGRGNEISKCKGNVGH